MIKKYNVGLVGCGTISDAHLGILSEIKNVSVVALCDILPERANAKAKAHSLDCKIFTSYEEMLEEEELDAVHICTPHYLHAKMAIMALQKNINVFLEKPLCISEEEINMILEAERASGGKICICFQNRFNPTTLLAKELVEKDGGAISAYANVIWSRDLDYYRKSGWRGSFATEGGGVMINQAIHTIDLLHIFLGIPKSVTATVVNHHLKDQIEVEDTAVGYVEFEGNKRANFYFTTAASGFNDTEICLFTRSHRVEIKGSSVYLDGVPQKSPALTDKYRVKECYGNSHEDLIGKFYASLDEDKDMPIPPEEAKWALKILLAAYRSEGNSISI